MLSIAVALLRSVPTISALILRLGTERQGGDVVHRQPQCDYFRWASRLGSSELPFAIPRRYGLYYNGTVGFFRL